MAKFSRLKVLNSIIETGMVPVFYHPDTKVAISVIKACADGGTHCFEFTNRGDQANEVFKELIIYFKKEDRVILGAGSIIDPATAALYIQLGANFIVGPVLNPEVARLCNRRKVAYFPGCGSVSEISSAEEFGVEICKIFPGGAIGGPAFVKDVLGPLPWSRLMPTGGVDTTEESVSSWFKAGVACVGMGSKLFPKETIDSGHYELITEKVKQVLQWIQKTRSGNSPIS
ncbi:MAG: bifunctional 4-hydroxy-2-oxoglutarate aldolase/2-dehydro-3-deoxy-phosphogluconate aldolase [Chloroflexi bacterium]|nr:bifunctional 4-hydroxy-2-oxoglutarate aldolase/2-dehydro-3-deoxy-phosphogluconate aldolase [Chloroflexota bacterium]